MGHVVVVGAGTIGSHLLPHVARMPGVTSVSVIDRDRYEATNLCAQNIYTRDIGKSKAHVHARRLRQIHHALAVRAIHMPVEEVPLGWLRGAAILACLDSRRARMAVNLSAWRLGVPWINAGINATGLARVQAFVPSADAACLECAWDSRDYELVEQDYPCQDGLAPPETAASSGLGALAAALQALECEKLLASDRECLLAGRDVLIDARHHRHYVTRFQRNAACRMPDHAGWAVTSYDADPSSVTLAELTAVTSTLRGADTWVRMAPAGQPFAMTLTCRRCRRRQPVARLYRGEWRRSLLHCQACGWALEAAGVDLVDQLALDELSEETRHRPLTDLGFLCGDVLTFMTPDVELHLELGGAVWPTES